ncbi:hypothetical protein D1831_01685 [Lactiplantibacillus garii]|uniref:Uncharacterized protein n=1 Tax=Lactiplantibacillus garii TaxID=2306423 RepID=A0A3R8J9V5_9LACO|nr:hypothetical protein [Lactiplantibacillus garii]RRK11597.1 hypothetical protein D1831_01685 [Lactiplantibacillus garii]
MWTIVTIIIGLIFAIIIYEILRRQVLKRTALKIRHAGQRTADGAMQTALTHLASAVEVQEVHGSLHSVPVADVWGRGVMAFEYVLETPGMVKADLPEVRRLFNNQFQRYADDQHITAFQNAGPALRVTDAWLRAGQLHVDVAYLMNEATLEYLDDLRRLNQSDSGQ